MFVLSMDAKKGLAATPIIWVKKTANETGYYWPLYGLNFKLKNYVPLPIEPQVLRKEWRWVPCTILLNGEKFKTYEDAEKALLNVLHEENERKSNEVESAEKEADEVETVEKEADKVETVEKEANEVETVEKEADEVETVEKEADEVETDEKEADEVESVEKAADKVETVEKEADEVEADVKDDDVESEVRTDEVAESDKVEAAELASSEVEPQMEAEKGEYEDNSEDNDNFPYFPIDDVPTFSCNETFLKSKSGFDQLEKFYNNINENSERKFFNKCVLKTFTDSFFLSDVAFKKDAKRKDWIGVFDDTRLYECIKKAVVKKLKLSHVDDTEVKNIFMTNFDRIKRAIRARC